MVNGIRKQDRKAQQAVFQKLNRKMFATCHRYITDAYEAEDVMMAGFMVVLPKLINSAAKETLKAGSVG